MAQLPGHPTLQVWFPRRIIRVRFTPNLQPPEYLHSGCFHQTDWQRLAFAVSDHPGEHPVAVARTLEVFPPDPPPAFLSMTLPAPPPEFPEDSVVHCREDACAHCKTVVHRPA